MAYIPGFKYDIFISYSPKDNYGPPGPQHEPWVTRFKQDLEIALWGMLGDKVSIFLDVGHGDDHAAIILNSLHNSALFLPIISPAYVAGDWYKNELREFQAAPNAQERTVPVELLPLNENTYPPQVKWTNKRAQFWVSQNNFARRLTPETDREKYYECVYTLANQLARQLRRQRGLPSEPSLEPETAPMGRPSVPSREPATVPSQDKDAVEFGISHPPSVAVGIPFLVDAWVFRHEDRNDAIRRAIQSALQPVHFRGGASVEVDRGTRLTVTLEIQPWKVEPDFQTIFWTGETANVPFHVTPTHDLPTDKVIGTCRISVNQFRIGHVFFELELTRAKSGSARVVQGRSIKSAFASYSSKDRRRVLARVAGLEKFVDVFMDVRNLKANDPYPTYLLEKIESSDVLYLFWSRHARQSQWVDKEWRYGMKNKGIDFIDPIPLVDPRKVPPPPELAAKKHFNDWTLVYDEWEKSRSIRHRLAAWLTGD
jgi:hypothetical protein